MVMFGDSYPQFFEKNDDGEITDDDIITIPELRARITRDQRLLLRLQESQQLGKLIGDATRDPASISAYKKKKKLVRSLEIILKHMIRITFECNAQGFVYGIVPESGRTISGVSDNLRDWWQTAVKFDRNGPDSISKYNTEIGIPGPNNPIRPRTVTPVLLLELQDSTLGSVLSALMPHCDPPQRKYRLNKGVSPPWWPKGDEDFWAELGYPNGLETQLPYKKPHDLQKALKAGVIISILRNLAPNTDKICMIIRTSRSLQDKMTSKELHALIAVVEQQEEVFWKNNRHLIRPKSSGRKIYEDLVEVTSGKNGDCRVNSGTDEDNKEHIKGNKNGDTNKKRAASEENKNGENEIRENEIRENEIRERSPKRAATYNDDDELTSFVNKGIYLCEYKGCRHNNYHFGFLKKSERDHHMEFSCKFKKLQPLISDNDESVEEARSIIDSAEAATSFPIVETEKTNKNADDVLTVDMESRNILDTSQRFLNIGVFEKGKQSIENQRNAGLRQMDKPKPVQNEQNLNSSSELMTVNNNGQVLEGNSVPDLPDEQIILSTDGLEDGAFSEGNGAFWENLGFIFSEEPVIPSLLESDHQNHQLEMPEQFQTETNRTVQPDQPEMEISQRSQQQQQMETNMQNLQQQDQTQYFLDAGYNGNNYHNIMQMQPMEMNQNQANVDFVSGHHYELEMNQNLAAINFASGCNYQFVNNIGMGNFTDQIQPANFIWMESHEAQSNNNASYELGFDGLI